MVSFIGQKLLVTDKPEIRRYTDVYRLYKGKKHISF